MRLHDTGPAIPSRKQCGFSTPSEGPLDPEDLVAGDARAIIQPGLASLHSMFVNEHNRIVRKLKIHPKLKLTLLLKMSLEEQVKADEMLYQEARKIVSAELQNIVYNEFLPIVLGSDGLSSHGLGLRDTSAYNSTIDATITNEFATVAFRFGHSLIPSIFERSPTPVTSVHDRWALHENFDKFDEFVLGHGSSGDAWKNQIVGAINQESAAMDSSISRTITDFLFCGENCGLPGGFGQDLAARNIQRGRDHGIPSYNTIRQFCGLAPLTDWASPPPEIPQEDWDNLKTVYTRVDDIDAFPGGLAETSTQAGGGLLGDTFSCILGRQFKALMEGDRYFFTHPANGSQRERGLKSRTKATVRDLTLGDIICFNTNSMTTKASVMSTLGEDVDCAARTDLDFDDIAADILDEPQNTTSSVDKILVTGGRSSPYLSSTELYPTSPSCSPPPLPTVRHAHVTFSLHTGEVAACGGYDDHTHLSSCLVLNTTARLWQTNPKVPHLTNSRYRSTAVVVSYGVFVLGGAGSRSTSSLVLRPDSTSWEKGPTLPGRGADLSCGVTLQEEGSFLVIGGRYEQSQVEEYQPSSTSWAPDNKWPDLLQGRFAHACATTGQSVVIAGGISGEGYLRSTEVLSTTSRTIRRGGDTSSARGYLSMVALSAPGSIYVLGGYIPGTTYQTVERWLAGTSTWTTEASMKEKRREMGAVAVNRDTICPA